MKNKISKVLFAAFLVVCLSVPALAAGLTRNRSTAIVLYDRNAPARYESNTQWDSYGGSSSTTYGAPNQGAALATEIIRKALLENGYKVVNANQLAAIRKAKASRLALEGNVEAIKKLSRQYGISQYVTGTVTVQKGVKNEFGLYTGGATITLNAYTSGGQYILAETATTKEVGYSEDEAAAKSVQSAAQQIATALTGESYGSGGVEGGCYVVVSGLRSFKAVQNVVNACRSVYGVTDAKAGEYYNGSSTIAVFGSFDMNELKNALAEKVPYSRITGADARSVYLQMY